MVHEICNHVCPTPLQVRNCIRYTHLFIRSLTAVIPRFKVGNCTRPTRLLQVSLVIVVVVVVVVVVATAAAAAAVEPNRSCKICCYSGGSGNQF